MLHRTAWLSAALVFCALPAYAGGPSKDQCIEAHSRGQDLREQRRLVRAKEQFLMCNQNGCPGPIQADCVKFLEQVDSMTPSVSFGARDDDKHDLPDTLVYLDGTLVVTRLDEGKLIDADPGPHAVRFVHGGREVTMKIVLTPGDKGRAIIGSFSSPTPLVRLPVMPPPPETRSGRSPWPLVVAGLGAAGIVTGTALYAIGMGRVPTECSVASHTCSAAPGDAAFERAHAGAALGNTGIGIALAGAAVTIGGLAWYFALPSSTERAQTAKLTPWLAPNAGGVTVGGAL